MKRRIHELERQRREANRMYDIGVIIAFIVIAGGLLMILFDILPH